MALIGVLLVTAVNCVVLLFLSMLAAGGDGGDAGIRVIRVWGLAWIAVLLLASLVLCARGRGRAAILVAVSALPVGYVGALGATLVGTFLRTQTPNSPEFTAACNGVGAVFIAGPVTPVRSIAYDWESEYPPQINFFIVDSNSHVAELRGGLGLSPYPPAIRFTESRCCQYEGRPRNGVGPYIRRFNGGEYFGVTEFSADALVTYRSSPVGPQSAESDLTQVAVTVVDRRDGRALASLRYVLDSRKRRACGTTSRGVMDERAFVLRAVGVQ